MYALTLTVMLMSGQTVDIELPGVMDAEQCKAEAAHQIAQGFEVVRCKDLTAAKNVPEMIHLPSGVVVIMEKAGENSVSIKTPDGRAINPDSLHKSDHAALMWATEKFLSKGVDVGLIRF